MTRPRCGETGRAWPSLDISQFGMGVLPMLHVNGAVSKAIIGLFFQEMSTRESVAHLSVNSIKTK